MKRQPTPTPAPVNAPAPTLLNALVPLEATERLLRKRDVLALVNMASSTLYKRIRAGQFPRQIHLDNSRMSHWKLSEVQAYINGTYTPPPVEPARPKLKLVRKGGKV